MSDLINRLCKLETANLSDAQSKIMGGTNFGCFSGTGIRNLNPQAGILCGYTVTCTIESTGPVKGPRITPALYEKIESGQNPVVVAVQGIGRDPEHTLVFGGRMTAISRKLGACAVVTNAGVRDIEDILKEGFGCYAAGLCPGAGNFTIKDINVPVEIGGAKIRPGDIVHGDRDGFIVLGDGPIEEIISLARKKQKKEQSYIEFLNSPEFSVAELKRRFYDVDETH